jgi:hypothetical protein
MTLFKSHLVHYKCLIALTVLLLLITVHHLSLRYYIFDTSTNHPDFNADEIQQLLFEESQRSKLQSAMMLLS